jgi:hypothetical protein
VLLGRIIQDRSMTGEASEIVLSKQDLREVTAFAAACAQAVLEIFEADQPDAHLAWPGHGTTAAP